MTILEQIATYKRLEIAAAKRQRPFDKVIAAAEAAPPVRPFAARIAAEIERGRPALIAEIKKASPSKGVIRADFDPPAIARAYAEGGAHCLSILTDGPSFQGEPSYLVAARAACHLPVLRKDFLFEPYQVVETRAMGADCILVIMACVDDQEASALVAEAERWGMDVLLETHDEDEIARALRLRARLIGINNRNLHTFETSLSVTEELRLSIPPDRIVVSESGIHGAQDIRRLRECGVHAFLVGESLMRAQDVAAATRELLSP